ncbi:MAG: RluA family pseudouridine synthase [Planctomycetota bacterium]|jgi:23S rRNA pseudouridine1911/1915/1917 synthase|nr:RluA family pseudouridine synthase [Planctomycetota bacterium]
MTPRFTAEAETDLRSLLRLRLPDWRRSTLRRRLALGLVLLNGEAVFRDDVRLAPGSEVRILPRPEEGAGFFLPGPGRPPLAVLYADSALLAVDKPAGLLSVASDREKRLTAIRLLREWLAGPGREDDRTLHSAHRLDRDASGVLLFARGLEIRRRLAAAWPGFEKIYLAVVDGVPPRPEGDIDLPLRQDRGLFVRPATGGDGKPSRTRYRLRERRGGRSLLEIRLDTGRKHQIRAHLAHIGCPVAGDRRYGGSRAPRLLLHAAELRLIHPLDGRELAIRSELPGVFRRPGSPLPEAEFGV